MMKRLVVLIGCLTFGAFTLAVLACVAPLLMLLRPHRPDARATDLDYGPDDPGVDVDGVE